MKCFECDTVIELTDEEQELEFVCKQCPICGFWIARQTIGQIGDNMRIRFNNVRYAKGQGLAVLSGDRNQGQGKG